MNEENRSSSPSCPKPDEPEEPLGTAMETSDALKGQSPTISGAPRELPEGRDLFSSWVKSLKSPNVSFHNGSIGC